VLYCIVFIVLYCCCCRSDTTVDSQSVAVSASTLRGSGVPQAISEAEVKSEPITPPPPQPTTTHEMFGVRNPALLHGGHYVTDRTGNRFQTVASDGRFPSVHSVGHRFQSSSQCSTPTAEASYRPVLGAHQSAAAGHFHPNDQTTTDLFQSDVTRFHSGVNRFGLGMEPFRGRLPDPAAGNIVNGGDRFQFLHPPRYLTNADRFHPVPAHLGDDCIANRFQLTGDSVPGGSAVVPSTNGPLNSLYHCHRDFDGGLYASAKRPRLTADDWLC